MPLEPTEADHKAATDYATSLPSVRSFGVRRQAYLAGVLAERERAVAVVRGRRTADGPLCSLLADMIEQGPQS